MLIFQIKSKMYFYIPITLLLIAAVFFRKEHVVSEKGVDIVYDILGFRTDNVWAWEDIAMIQPDYMKAAPNTMVIFEKNTSMLRPFVFEPDDAIMVLEFAKKMNPEIYVDSFTAEEQEEMEKEKKKAKARARSQKKKRK